MKDEIYLAPCLLCHSKNVKLVNHTGALQQNYKGIRCMDCGLATRTALFSINEIINQWNDSSHPPHEPCMVIYKPKEFIRELEQALNNKDSTKKG